MATKKKKTLEDSPKALQATLDRVVVELAKSDEDRIALQERCRRYEEELVTIKRELTQDLTKMSGQLNTAIKERDAFQVELRKAVRETPGGISVTLSHEKVADLSERHVAQEKRIAVLEGFIRRSVQTGLNFTEAGEVLKGSA